MTNTPRRFKGQTILFDDRRVVHVFEKDDNDPKHILSLECACHPTPFTVTDEMEGMEINRTGQRIFRCLRHNLIMPTTVFKEVTGGNMQLTDNEGSYHIQDAATQMPKMAMTGRFSESTAKLLRDQIENMYEAEDLKNTE
jgi:hypothetical protein